MVFKDDDTYILTALKHSRSVKIKSHWSRVTGTGWLAEEILSITKLDDHAIAIRTKAFVLNGQTSELNLRETEECLKFMELKLLRDAMQKRQAIIDGDQLPQKLALF
jgi:hypothetical protein